LLQQIRQTEDYKQFRPSCYRRKRVQTDWAFALLRTTDVLVYGHL
jgi:hypothetical protein